MVLLKAGGAMNKTNEQTDLSEASALPPPVHEKKLSREKLILGYTDPFLKNDAPASNSNEKYSLPATSKIIKEKKIIEKSKPDSWPAVKFYGLVRNTTSNKMVAIISINNKQKKMTNGDITEDVKLEKITRDSILVSWNKEKKYIRK
jgi:hypothetical protein